MISMYREHGNGFMMALITLKLLNVKLITSSVIDVIDFSIVSTLFAKNHISI